jgi:hypothetical protein
MNVAIVRPVGTIDAGVYSIHAVVCVAAGLAEPERWLVAHVYTECRCLIPLR